MVLFYVVHFFFYLFFLPKLVSLLLSFLTYIMSYSMIYHVVSSRYLDFISLLAVGIITVLLLIKILLNASCHLRPSS